MTRRSLPAVLYTKLEVDFDNSECRKYAQSLAKRRAQLKRKSDILTIVFRIDVVRRCGYDLRTMLLVHIKDYIDDIMV